jgi:hypothetical protein
MKIFERFLSRKPTPKTEDEIALLIEGFAKQHRWALGLGLLHQHAF